MISTLLECADALADDDVPRLVELSWRFERPGLWMFAAEAMIRTSELPALQGHG